MPDYKKLSFKNKDIDKLVKKDTVPKPTYKRFNVPLYTGLVKGKKRDSVMYERGFKQGVKNFNNGNPGAISLYDGDNFHRAGKLDGVEAMTKKKALTKKKSKK